MAKKKLEIKKISKFTKPNKVSRKVKKKSAKKVKKTVKRSGVIVYSTPTCPWCKKAKEFLQKHKVAFKDFDVSADSKARNEMIKKSDQMGVPVLDIRGTIVIGYDIDKIVQALKIRKKNNMI